jgi:hypothetical protein
MGFSFIKCDDATAAEAVISTLHGGVSSPGSRAQGIGYRVQGVEYRV